MRLCIATIALCALVSACDVDESSSTAAPAQSQGKTLGFALAYMDGVYKQQDDKADCPDGFRYTSREQWEAQFATRAARQVHLNRCIEINNRGPNCENGWFQPMAIDDPLPVREVQNTIAQGADLDGVGDAVATPRTCAHRNFVSPDGTAGIDNQFHRFIGCNKTVRGFREEGWRRGVAGRAVYWLLLEVVGVDDERNDGDVQVTMYRSRDPVTLDANLKAPPWQTKRIDGGPHGVLFSTRGKIIDGMLVTDPVNVEWEREYYEQRLLIRDMSLRLKLTPTGAEGLRVGYIDLDKFWASYARYMSGMGVLYGASGPSDFRALHRLADGYKNPETGACTALSSAHRLEFVHAHLIHPDVERKP